MKPLKLTGRFQILGTSARDKGQPTVIRLRSGSERDDVSSRDYAIVRSVTELDQARRNGFFNFLAYRSHGLFQAAAPSWEVESALLVEDEQDFLAADDLVRVDFRSTRLRVIYRSASHHKSFFVTERCNHLCLMCSQPPRDVDDDWLLAEIADATELIRKPPRRLGFTGGEPLTRPSEFMGLLKTVGARFPEAQLDVLTNGRAFADPRIAKTWSSLGNKNLTACIPIYSSVAHVHDFVVQARGAFEETVMGLLRLADLKQSIQLRVVLHAISVRRLRDFCSWIARNLPFVSHVALMGLEHTGFALANESMLWVDPADYADDLAWGVKWLHQAGMSVSLFNLQRCVLPKEVRPFAARSISDWKNAYLQECDPCKEKSDCAGFFSSGRPRFSRAIRPIC